MLRRNGPVVKFVESVLRPEDYYGHRWERFVKEVSFEQAGSERVREFWMARMVR